ncbi:MAG: hypothetical protein JSR86_18500 [Proteobacteria bacterium]|nr:hypothetical protein [Pseudomonadota bacterium]
MGAETFLRARPGAADGASLAARAHQLLGRAQALADVTDWLALLADPLRRGQASLSAGDTAQAHAVMNTLVSDLAQVMLEIHARLDAARDEVDTETALVLAEATAIARGGEDRGQPPAARMAARPSS